MEKSEIFGKLLEIFGNWKNPKFLEKSEIFGKSVFGKIRNIWVIFGKILNFRKNPNFLEKSEIFGKIRNIWKIIGNIRKLEKSEIFG